MRLVPVTLIVAFIILLLCSIGLGVFGVTYFCIYGYLDNLFAYYLTLTIILSACMVIGILSLLAEIFIERRY